MIAVNPVLAREMRSRMRGSRAALLITFWLVFNGFVLTVVYLSAENRAEQQFGFGNFANTVTIGRGIYGWTLFAMLLLMLLIVPAQAAGAIAGERERQTLVPLQVTMLSPWRILVGKISASVAFLVLLVVTALPLLAVGYLVGGIGMGDVLTGAGAVLLTGFLLAAMCTAISTFTRRVQAATVLCYALVLALAIGTLLSYGAYAIIDQSRGTDQTDPPAVLLLANPIAFVSDIVGVDERDASNEIVSPFDLIHRLVQPSDSTQFDGSGPAVFDASGRVVGVQAADPPDRDSSPFWLYSGLVLLTLAAGGSALAARALRTPAETER